MVKNALSITIEQRFKNKLLVMGYRVNIHFIIFYHIHRQYCPSSLLKILRDYDHKSFLV